MQKYYKKDIDSSFIEYLDASNLYGWAMSQKLPVNAFKWIKKEQLSNVNENFIRNYDENSNKGYFFEVYINYPKELFNLHKDLSFLPETKKVNKLKKINLWHRKQKEICYSHKIFKTSTN